MIEPDMQKITVAIESRKRQLLSRQDLYDHIQNFQDAALLLKGQAMSSAEKNGAEFSELWKWCLDQLD